MTSIRDYLCNLIAGKSYISHLYYSVDRARDLRDNAKCFCVKVFFPGIGSKVYKGSQLLRLDDKSFCTTVDQVVAEIPENGKPTVDQFVLLLLIVRGALRRLYQACCHAGFLQQQAKIFCFTFVNPFGIYAGVTRNCISFKGYFNFSKFFCQCQKKRFDPLLVLGGLNN